MQVPYCGPTILKCTVNLSVIWRFLLGMVMYREYMFEKLICGQNKTLSLVNGKI